MGYTDCPLWSRVVSAQSRFDLELIATLLHLWVLVSMTQKKTPGRLCRPSFLPSVFISTQHPRTSNGLQVHPIEVLGHIAPYAEDCCMNYITQGRIQDFWIGGSN